VLLSAAGIYSMMSYSVSQRMHEFGVRLALGATARDVLRLTLRQAALLTAAGLVLGLVASIVIGSFMSSAMFGLIALDRTTVAVVGLALAAVAFTAAYVPSRRALRLDPSSILRAQ
jgi:putative ABC transport system permease protein